MKYFPHAYKFYDLSEDERKELIGTYFKESRYDNGTLYFPVQLHEDDFNYGIQQGLISVSPIWKLKDGTKWFRVAAFSPDDLDKDLDFKDDECKIHQEVIEYIKQMPKKFVTYDSILLDIQWYFNAGKRTS